MIQLVVGDGAGQVSALRVPVNGEPPKAGFEATQRLHSGPVLAATFLSRGRVATGGADRKLIVCGWEDGQLLPRHELRLTLPCSGVKTVGVEGDRKRQVLEALRDSAEGQRGDPQVGQSDPDERGRPSRLG
jgi:hypothetical protein